MKGNPRPKLAQLLATRTHCNYGHKFTPNNTRTTQGYRACRTCGRERMKHWRLKNPERSREIQRLSIERNPLTLIKYRLKTLFNLSLEDYNRLFRHQSYVCAGCKKPPEPNKLLTIDHNHNCCQSEKSCGKCIRGLLCRNCNAILGFCNDSPEILRNLEEYISGKS